MCPIITSERARHSTKSRQTRPGSFRWYGSKGNMMPSLIPLFPHHDRYVSVFGGSGADISGKPRSRVEVYNDLNCDLVNFYAVLRSVSDRRTLQHWLEHTPICRTQFEECAAIVAEGGGIPVRRAWAFFYCLTFAFAGRDPALAKSGAFAPSLLNRQPAKWRNVREHIDGAARRYREVLLENMSWDALLDKYDADQTLFYLDPPYVKTTRQSPTVYRHEMSDAQHVTLLERLQFVKARVMLSGYDCALYQEYLGAWRRVAFQVKCSCSANHTKPERTEVVWMNYETCGARIKTS